MLGLRISIFKFVNSYHSESMFLVLLFFYGAALLFASPSPPPQLRSPPQPEVVSLHMF